MVIGAPGAGVETFNWIGAGVYGAARAGAAVNQRPTKADRIDANTATTSRFAIEPSRTIRLI
jgi:hypothetical protein